MLHRLLTLTLTLGLVVAGVAGCGYSPATSPPPPGQVITLNLQSEPPQLDPIRMTDVTSFNVINQLMRGLTTFGPGQAVKSAVAKSWTLSPDGTTYTFTLRQDAKWSDGAPVTAQQFIDNWQRALTPENGSGYAFFLFPIRNAQAYYEGQLKDFNQVGIKALGPRTLQVTLRQPTPFFPTLLAAPVYLPIRLDALERHGVHFTEAGNLLSNGPYVLTSWEHQHKMTLAPNPHYWAPNQQIERLNLLMIQEPNTALALYESGELDLLEPISPADHRWLKTKPEARLQPTLGLYYLGFNVERPPFDNVKVRQALALAVDRGYFPKLLASGQTPIQQFLPPALQALEAPAVGLSFNPELAQKRLSEAGYPGGEGFPEVELVFPNRESARKEAEIVQFLWKRHLGITVRLKAMDWKVFLSTLQTKPPGVYRLSWFADYPDPDTFLRLFHSTNGNNYSGWTSPEYDRLIEQAASTNDPKRRQSLYFQAQKLLLEAVVAVVPWYSPEKLWLLKPDVCGVELNTMTLWLLDNAHRCPDRQTRETP